MPFYIKHKEIIKKAINCLIEAMELAAEENLIGFFLFSIDEVGDPQKENIKLPNLTNEYHPKLYRKLSLCYKEKINLAKLVLKLV